MTVAHPASTSPPDRRLVAHRGRARIRPFALHRPRDFAAARRLLDEFPGSLPVAAGMEVANRMKEGEAPTALVWLGGIPGGASLLRQEDHLVAGALLRHEELAHHPEVRAWFPDLGEAWGRIANARIRAQGTVAGNVMAAMPGYEAATLLVAAGACLTGLRPGGEPFDAPLAPPGPPLGSLVTGFRIPLPAPGHRRRLLYDRSLRPALSVALCLDLVDGHVGAARAVLGGTHPYPTPQALPTGGMALRDLPGAAAELARAAFADLANTLSPDGIAAYRARVAPVLLARLIERAAR